MIDHPPPPFSYWQLAERERAEKHLLHLRQLVWLPILHAAAAALTGWHCLPLYPASFRGMPSMALPSHMGPLNLLHPWQLVWLPILHAASFAPTGS